MATIPITINNRVYLIDLSINESGLRVCEKCHTLCSREKRVDTINVFNGEDSYCLPCYESEMDKAVSKRSVRK